MTDQPERERVTRVAQVESMTELEILYLLGSSRESVGPAVAKSAKDKLRVALVSAEVPADSSEEGQEPMSGVELIATERERQITEEGWTPEHDDQHERFEDLARAAACYADPRPTLVNRVVRDGLDERSSSVDVPLGWPRGWDWKPKDRLTDLIRAGALIAAEIDRLQRAVSAANRSEEGDKPRCPKHPAAKLVWDRLPMEYRCEVCGSPPLHTPDRSGAEEKLARVREWAERLASGHPSGAPWEGTLEDVGADLLALLDDPLPSDQGESDG